MYTFNEAQRSAEIFMEAARQPVRATPTTEINPGEPERIKEVLNSEVEELHKAIAEKNLVEIADGIGDIIYVLLTVSATHGIDIGPVVQEICNNNLLKLEKKPYQFSPTGKLLKPAGHPPPDIKGVLERQENLLGFTYSVVLP